MLGSKPRGYGWRSSSAFIIFTAVLALFTESFLYTFIVPILSYMIEFRLYLPASQTQKYTTGLLAIHGLAAMISAPIIAHSADKFPSRKGSLLLCLAGIFAGTVLLALTPSVWAMFVGRVIQAIASSAGWIVAFATLADNVPMEHLGKTLGLASSFVSAGIISGPTVSGTLLELAGYWAAWAVPFALLGIDLVARLLMLEAPKPKPQRKTQASSTDEEQTLLSPTQPPPQPSQAEPKQKPRGFYRTVLCNAAGVVGLLNTFVFSLTLTGLDSTLPLHLRNTFGWTSLQTSMIFLALQVPGPFLSPLVGALRDKVGLRNPTTIGWILTAVSLYILGIPGQEGISWASPEPGKAGTPILVGATIALGAVTPFVRGVAMIQLMAMVDQLQSENPGILGEHGGTSKVFSSLEIAFNLGTTAGPLLAGSVVEALGFYYTNCILAAIALSLAALSFMFLEPAGGAKEKKGGSEI
ncbi:MFS general substrate transporter [Aspergillus unguis]